MKKQSKGLLKNVKQESLPLTSDMLEIKPIQKKNVPKPQLKELPQEIDWENIQLNKKPVQMGIQQEGQDFGMYMQTQIQDNKQLQKIYENKTENSNLKQSKLKQLPNLKPKNISQLSNSTHYSVDENNKHSNKETLNTSQKQISSTQASHELSQKRTKSFKISDAKQTTQPQQAIQYPEKIWKLVDYQRKNLDQVRELQEYIDKQKEKYKMDIDLQSEMLKTQVRLNNDLEELSNHSQQFKFTLLDTKLLETQQKLDQINQQQLKENVQKLLSQSDLSLGMMKFSDIKKQSVFLTKQNQTQDQQSSYSNNQSENYSENKELFSLTNDDKFVKKNIKEAFMNDLEKLENNLFCSKLTLKEQDRIEHLINEDNTEPDPFGIEETDLQQYKENFMKAKRNDKILEQKMLKINEELLQLAELQSKIPIDVSKKAQQELKQILESVLNDQEYQPNLLQKLKAQQFEEIQEIHKDAEKLCNEHQNKGKVILNEVTEYKNELESLLIDVLNGDLSKVDESQDEYFQQTVKMYIKEAKYQVKNIQIDFDEADLLEKQLEQKLTSVQNQLDVIEYDKNEVMNDKIEEILKQIERVQLERDQIKDIDMGDLPVFEYNSEENTSDSIDKLDIQV